MNIKEIKARSIITKSGLPGSDFTINPYVGCLHSCIYCYAKFMKKFTNHHEAWGKFLDIKVNAPELIPKKTDKYAGKSIVISSVTDPYQPAERKYKLMRRILVNLVPLKPDLCVITKSDLIIRDIDLLKEFENCTAGVSLSLLDEDIRRDVEPLASSAQKRINAVKELKKAGINTFIFISPIFPELTDWKEIIDKTADFTDEFWFENLNVRATNRSDIWMWLKRRRPDLSERYRAIYFTKNNYWDWIEGEIRTFCRRKGVNYSIFFHN